ncbi:MAG: RnfH family protein [Gammaproteobacteria bacterium]|nr:RnfH family protein [Gammaproteobacteria bacterium]
MGKVNQFLVEVAYAGTSQQHILAVTAEPGCTIETAIERSGILELYPEIDLTQQKVGIFSQLKQLNDTVQAGDRVEIYRPLTIDPKEARKRRAKSKP